MFRVLTRDSELDVLEEARISFVSQEGPEPNKEPRKQVTKAKSLTIRSQPRAASDGLLELVQEG